MQEPEQLSPAERVIPLAYARQAAPANEMVWIVRFIAVYLFVMLLAPVIFTIWRLAGKIARTSLIDVFWNTGWILLTYCALTLILIAMWHLRREAFWALLVLCALPPLHTMVSGSYAWLPFMPSAIMTVAVVFLIYRRATVRGALHPATLREISSATAGADMTWFMGIVGFWALIPAVSRLSTWAMEPITGQYGFTFRNLIVTNCVNIAAAILMAGIGTIQIASKTHRALPLLAATFLLAGIGSDVAIRWDLSHNPKFVGTTFLHDSGFVYGLMMCCLTIVLYRSARQDIRRDLDDVALNASHASPPVGCSRL